jgi:putative protease
VIDLEGGNELEIDNEYIMSAQDLCTIDFIDEVLDSGVVVLKIEGRGKGPEYVKTVTQCYREAVDAWLAGTYTREKALQWKDKMEQVFNRGFWSGYYLGQELGAWNDSAGSKAKLRKIYLGKGNRYFSQLGVGEFLIETHSLKVGDTILITGPTTGVIETVVEELHTDQGAVDKAVKGNLCSIKLDSPIRKSDKLYKLVSASE